MLILAGITIAYVFGDNSVFNKASEAKLNMNMAKAREKLELVLLVDATTEKNINLQYNQDEFLNTMILQKIQGAEIKGDVAIVDGFAFELDRSVPKIGESLGDADKLVFPTVTVSDSILATNYKTSSFMVTAIEEKNGINKIELWLEGKRIETHTENYSNIKTEVTKEFVVNKNGTYTVKVYGDLMTSETVEVTGIVPSIEFTPNGNTEWKKQHITKVTVKETDEAITKMKYLWVKDDGVNEPEQEVFTENCPSNGLITGGDETMTGTYYLWILLEVGTGEKQKISMYASKGFNFDNEGPTSVTATLTKKSGEIYTLNIDCIKGISDIKKINVISNSEKKEAIKQSDTRWSIEITNTPDYINNVIFEIDCSSGDMFRYSTRTNENYAELWDIKMDRTYSWKWKSEESYTSYMGVHDCYTNCNVNFNESTGKWSLNGGTRTTLSQLKAGEIVRSASGFFNGLAVRTELATSGKYNGMIRLVYRQAQVSIESEEKLKGENLLGIQFCAKPNELITQGVNTYMNKEYYCVKK